MSGLWKQARKFVFHRILHADDTPHRIALGVGLAVFVAFTPTLGLQTVLALAIATALRANKAVCVPLVWITNPATAVPVYWFCWRVGSGILDGPGAANPDQVLDRMSAAASLSSVTQLFQWSFWSAVGTMILELGSELWLGCCLIGLVCGGVSYFATRWGVTNYRRRRNERKMRRNAARPAHLQPPAPRDTVLSLRESA